MYNDEKEPLYEPTREELDNIASQISDLQCLRKEDFDRMDFILEVCEPYCINQFSPMVDEDCNACKFCEQALDNYRNNKIKELLNN